MCVLNPKKPPTTKGPSEGKSLRERCAVRDLNPSQGVGTRQTEWSTGLDRKTAGSLDGTPPAMNGRRTWWAHFEFTRINSELTILPKKIEEL